MDVATHTLATLAEAAVSFSDNYLHCSYPVLLAVVLAQVFLGFVYYGFIVQTSWERYMINEKKLHTASWQPSMSTGLLASTVSAALKAGVMAHLIHLLGITCHFEAATLAGVTWVGFTLGYVHHYSWENRYHLLVLIDVVFELLSNVVCVITLLRFPALLEQYPF